MAAVYPNAHLPASAGLIRLGESVRGEVLFQKGDILAGRILRVQPDGRMLLRLRGCTLNARALSPIQVGGFVSLRVEQSRPTPVLRLLESREIKPPLFNAAKILAAIEENIWRGFADGALRSGLSAADREHTARLVHFLTRGVYDAGGTALLKHIITGLGLKFEAKLLAAACRGRPPVQSDIKRLVRGDLKGTAAKALMHTEASGFLKRFVGALDQIQLLNHTALQDSRQIFLPIPMHPPGAGFPVGQLLIELPEKKDDETVEHRRPAVTRLTFALTLSRLGPVRAVLIVQEQQIQAAFYLADASARALVETNLPEFADALAHRGYQVMQMICALQDPETLLRPLLWEAAGGPQTPGHWVA